MGDRLLGVALAALVGRGDIHVLAVLGDRAAGQLDSLGLEYHGQLIIG